MNLHHIALEVRDLEVSSSFYEGMLGFKVEERLELGGEEILFLRIGNARLELIRALPKQDLCATIHLCFEVASLEEILFRFSDRGIKVLEGPLLLENGWQALFVKGPDGELLEFLKP